jgi:hypothetical protein
MHSAHSVYLIEAFVMVLRGDSDYFPKEHLTVFIRSVSCDVRNDVLNTVKPALNGPFIKRNLS